MPATAHPQHKASNPDGSLKSDYDQLPLGTVTGIKVGVIALYSVFSSPSEKELADLPTCFWLRLATGGPKRA